jgi:hypothetical protein
MKKVLFSLGGAVLLVAMLTVPALAGPVYQSDMICKDFSLNVVGGGFTVIQKASGDLFVKVSGLTPGDVFDCAVTCAGVIQNLQFPCGTVNAAGKLNFNFKQFATGSNLGVPECQAPFVDAFGSFAFCEASFIAP